MKIHKSKRKNKLNKTIKNKTRNNKPNKEVKLVQNGIVKLVRIKQVSDKCDIIDLASIEQYTEKNIKFNEQVKKIFVKQLLSNFSLDVPATNCFYNHVNNMWLKAFRIEKGKEYMTQHDNFRVVQHKVYLELDTIVNDYIKTEKNHSDSAKYNSIKSFYNAALNQNSISSSRQHAKNILNKIDELRKDKTNLYKMMTLVNKDNSVQFTSPFVLTHKPDFSNPSIFRMYIECFHFPVIDVKIYNIDDERHKENAQHWYTYTKELFDTILGKGHGMDTHNIFEVQSDIYRASLCKDISESNSYTRVSTKEATKYGFDWQTFTKEMGFDKTPDFFITNNVNYLKCGMELLQKEWDSDKWRPFWVWIFIRVLSRVTKGWEYMFYNFVGKYEYGQEHMITDQRLNAPIFMGVVFNEFLTNAYVEKFKDVRVIKYVETLCNDLKEVFIRFIEKNSWLSPITKQHALKKLKYLKFILSNPDITRADPILPYGSDFYTNIQMYYAWRHSYFVKLNGIKVFDIPYIDWTSYPIKLSGDQAYVVNASYTPLKNSIYINLGYMQKPFIDLGRALEYNLGNIGFTIAHELSHALDNNGRHYDYDGSLHNWWTDEDVRKYKIIQNDIIKQYNNWGYRDNAPSIDVSIGIGEDIADISGLAICDEYLRNYENYKEMLIPEKRVCHELFYICYAKQMRQMVSKKAITALRHNNPHPDDKYRTNVPLSRSQIFRALYNVKPNDDMYWHNTEVVW